MVFGKFLLFSWIKSNNHYLCYYRHFEVKCTYCYREICYIFLITKFMYIITTHTNYHYHTSALSYTVAYFIVMSLH
jgi:hypothetical protein